MNPRPWAVDNIAGMIGCYSVFPFTIGTVFALSTTLLMATDGFSLLTFQFLCTTLAIFGFGFYLVILARDFRALKRWTYYHVELCADWSILALFGFSNLFHREDVQRAFGMKNEYEADETYESDNDTEDQPKDD